MTTMEDGQLRLIDGEARRRARRERRERNNGDERRRKGGRGSASHPAEAAPHLIDLGDAEGPWTRDHNTHARGMRGVRRARRVLEVVRPRHDRYPKAS